MKKSGKRAAKRKAIIRWFKRLLKREKWLAVMYGVGIAIKIPIMTYLGAVEWLPVWLKPILLTVIYFLPIIMVIVSYITAQSIRKRRKKPQ
jgi:hypothetical protein